MWRASVSMQRMWLVRISPAIGRPQTDFAPAGKLYRNSHLGKHFDPKKLGSSGLSHGFKSLLLHQISRVIQRLFSGDRRSVGQSWGKLLRVDA